MNLGRTPRRTASPAVTSPTAATARAPSTREAMSLPSNTSAKGSARRSRPASGRCRTTPSGRSTPRPNARGGARRPILAYLTLRAYEPAFVMLSFLAIWLFSGSSTTTYPCHSFESSPPRFGQRSASVIAKQLLQASIEDEAGGGAAAGPFGGGAAAGGRFGPRRGASVPCSLSLRSSSSPPDLPSPTSRHVSPPFH